MPMRIPFVLGNRISNQIHSISGCSRSSYLHLVLVYLQFAYLLGGNKCNSLTSSSDGQGSAPGTRGPLLEPHDKGTLKTATLSSPSSSPYTTSCFWSELYPLDLSSMGSPAWNQSSSYKSS